MGHTSLLVAAAATAACPPGTWLSFPRLTLDARSCVSNAVAALLSLACSLRELSLGAGDSKLAFLLCCGAGDVGFEGTTAGESERPLPRMRPPPRDLPEAFIVQVSAGR